MKHGVRRGHVPEEEIIWLRRHVVCDSINQLFRDYSARFGQPYTAIKSFRKLLSKHEIYPIIRLDGYDNVNEMLMMISRGSTHWKYRTKAEREGIIDEPHWLWRWHDKSKRTPTGVSFRPYTKCLKEKQFGEDLDD